MYFYPRSPCGERPSSLILEASANIFLSTLSLRRATGAFYEIVEDNNISIHALLAESDGNIDLSEFNKAVFLSTLSLRRATRKSPHCLPGHRFLSTLSLRRATRYVKRLPRRAVHFYPRSPCGERPRKSQSSGAGICISIHALLAESDLRVVDGSKSSIISIHALLAESDSKSAQNSGALLRIWNKFYGDCIFMLTGKAVFYPFCPCFFHIFWCEGTGNFMIAFPSH